MCITDSAQRAERMTSRNVRRARLHQGLLEGPCGWRQRYHDPRPPPVLATYRPDPLRTLRVAPLSQQILHSFVDDEESDKRVSREKLGGTQIRQFPLRCLLIALGDRVRAHFLRPGAAAIETHEVKVAFVGPAEVEQRDQEVSAVPARRAVWHLEDR